MASPTVTEMGFQHDLEQVDWSVYISDDITIKGRNKQRCTNCPLYLQLRNNIPFHIMVSCFEAPSLWMELEVTIFR